MKTTGLYIHYPFCRKICPYCHFIKTLKREQTESLYFEALKGEIKIITSLMLKFDTLYFGGGTPSLMSSKIVKILEWIFKYLETEFKEISIEVNPEDVSFEFIKILKKSGVTRVSLGIQQFNEKLLKILRREHTLSDILKAVEKLKKENFVLNYDFIIGIPEESMSNLEKSIKFIEKHPPDSASIYILEGVKGKYWQKFKELEEDKKVEHFSMFEKFLESMGISRYEISNFSVKGKESLHNLKYWNYENFIGIGPSAASLLNNKRWENKSSIYSWSEAIKKGKPPSDKIFELSLSERAKEAVMMGLRKVKGINRKEFKLRFGGFPETFIPTFNEKKSFFEIGNYLKVKKEFLLIINSVLDGLF